jgi:hypothetical protein
MRIVLVEKLAGSWWRAWDDDALAARDVVWCGRSHKRFRVASPEDGLEVGDVIDVPDGEVRVSRSPEGRAVGR